jgi:hypothetical protein
VGRSSSPLFLDFGTGFKCDDGTVPFPRLSIVQESLVQALTDDQAPCEGYRLSSDVRWPTGKASLTIVQLETYPRTAFAIVERKNQGFRQLLRTMRCHGFASPILARTCHNLFTPRHSCR